jgi:fructose-bisphosphate aldolase class 1
MFKETLYQSTADGTPFVDVLARQGVLSGIKVDEVSIVTMAAAAAASAAAAVAAAAAAAATAAVAW